LVLMTGAKFLRINLKVLHPTVIYLQRISIMYIHTGRLILEYILPPNTTQF